MRSFVLLLLALVWLEPVIATYTTRTITATTAILIDASASMSVLDHEPGSGEETRIERVGRLCDSDQQAWLKCFAAKNDLRIYTFGERLTRRSLSSVSTDDANGTASEQAAALSWSAEENQTDFGEALSGVLDELGENPLAGIVVITDGIFNEGMHIDDAIAYARRCKAEVYAIGVGVAKEPPNIRVMNISAPATAAKGDPFEARVVVGAAGIEQATVRLELRARLEGREAAEAELLETRELTVGGGVEEVEARFRLNADEAGEYIYEARLAAVPGEALESDNLRVASVQVLDEIQRVLLVAGQPSYEYRFVTRLLERDKTIDVSCWLQSADEQAVRDGDTIITHLPRTPEEVFEYDVLLLLDPNPNEFDAAWAITVRRLVDEFGGGLFLQAGSHHTSRWLRDPRLEELTAILPVLPDPDADVRVSEQGGWRTRAQAFHVMEATATHALTRMQSDAAASSAIWRSLPGVWWYLPVLREKPLAEVLLRHGNAGHATRYGSPVLLATQPFGAGRTVFMAFDGTWRWRGTGEQYFNRFWIQLVRYLAQARREGISKYGTIVLDRETIRPGDYVKVEAQVLDASFVPWHGNEIEGEIVRESGRRRELRLQAIPGRMGWFAGHVAIDWTGAAVIRIPLPPNARPVADREVLSKHIRVEPADVELRSLALRAEQLTRLADQTQAKYLPLAEAGSLPDLIANASQIRTTRGTDRPLWDNKWLVTLVAVLLGIEWALRRWSHLL